jgi:diadenosine tetraphosphate (Ap4A) HIT family hydrolase
MPSGVRKNDPIPTSSMARSTPCELCETPGGTPIWRDASCRVVLVAEPDYPGFCRAIWNAHAREMTDLAGPERARFMEVVFAVETALRELLAPEKINLASLGNVTPHLHWHIIPRFRDDPHFPNPIWGARARGPNASAQVHADVAGALAKKLSRLGV